MIAKTLFWRLGLMALVTAFLAALFIHSVSAAPKGLGLAIVLAGIWCGFGLGGFLSSYCWRHEKSRLIGQLLGAWLIFAMGLLIWLPSINIAIPLDHAGWILALACGLAALCGRSMAFLVLAIVCALMAIVSGVFLHGALRTLIIFPLLIWLPVVVHRPAWRVCTLCSTVLLLLVGGGAVPLLGYRMTVMPPYTVTWACLTGMLVFWCLLMVSQATRQSLSFSRQWSWINMFGVIMFGLLLAWPNLQHGRFWFQGETAMDALAWPMFPVFILGGMAITLVVRLEKHRRRNLLLVLPILVIVNAVLMGRFPQWLALSHWLVCFTIMVELRQRTGLMFLTSLGLCALCFQAFVGSFAFIGSLTIRLGLLSLIWFVAGWLMNQRSEDVEAL